MKKALKAVLIWGVGAMLVANPVCADRVKETYATTNQITEASTSLSEGGSSEEQVSSEPMGSQETAESSEVESTTFSSNEVVSETKSSSEEGIKESTTKELSVHSEARAEEIPSVSYTAHSQNKGWGGWLKDGKLAGSTGAGKRLEALKIKIEGLTNTNGGVSYQTHVQNKGWLKEVSDGALSGTTGKALRVEALRIQLTGELKNTYDIYYRVHSAEFGWLGWAKNGEKAGSEKYGRQAEAFEIKLLRKGDNSIPTGNAFKVKTPKFQLSYATHVQNIGWQSWKSDGELAGTTGQSKRVEAFKVRLENSPYKGNVLSQTHVQNRGWMGTQSNGRIAGTVGQGLRVEALRFKLSGDISRYFDICYRVHVQNYGWQQWKRNNETTGTEGLGLRIEAVQIKLVKKGQSIDQRNSWLYTKETQLSAHRGAQRVAPENTIEAINEAADLSYDAVEIDVRKSKNGTNYLLHDERIDRVAVNGKGRLADLTDKQIDALKLKVDNYPKYRYAIVKIPRYDSAIMMIAKRGLAVNIDGSKGDWRDKRHRESIVQTLKKYGMYDKSFFVLSNTFARNEFMKENPNGIITWLHDPKVSINKEIAELSRYQNALFSIHVSHVKTSDVQKLHSYNIPIHVYGVEDQTTYDRLKAQGIRLVETNTLVPK